jgi:hypothetical protein
MNLHLLMSILRENRHHRGAWVQPCLTELIFYLPSHSGVIYDEASSANEARHQHLGQDTRYYVFVAEVAALQLAVECYNTTVSTRGGTYTRSVRQP